MKHLQPYYKQAIRQILSENRLSALFDVDQIYDVLCTFPTPQTAADHICTLRNNENFTGKKLETSTESFYRLLFCGHQTLELQQKPKSN